MTAPASPPPRHSPRRCAPAAHFTARDTWLNDPNGLLYHDGIYHLFFQTNPHGAPGGTSPGATPPRPISSPGASRTSRSRTPTDEMVFSGSAVVDIRNTAGFAGPGETALVAIYTSARPPRDGAPGIPGAVPRLQRGRRSDLDPVRREPGPGHRVGRVPRPEGVLVRRRRRPLGHGRRRSRRARRSSSTPPPTCATGPAPRASARRTPIGGVWECPDLFPLRVAGDRRDPLGARRQPEPRRDRRRLWRPVLRRRLRRHDLHRGAAHRLHRSRRLRLAGLRPRLLRRGLLQRRPGRSTPDDRVGQQLAVRQRDPDAAVALRDVARPRG